MVILDGNEAAASVAYRLSEVVAIYPITPSSPMAEWADQWRSEGKKNIWGALPIVEELQSEGGAAGALHGALQAGAFGTTFTASQGLLLMIPNMFKIAGELTPATMHVTARTLATHALSIFGDHSRRDGLPVDGLGDAGLELGAGSGRHGAGGADRHAGIAAFRSCISLTASAPRTKWARFCPSATRRSARMVDDKYIIEYRQNALSPDRPIIRGTAQNPDVFFQAREACTPFHAAVPGIVQSGDGPLCRADRPRLSSVRLLRRAGCGARDCADGFGRGGGRRGRGRAGQAGREGGHGQGSPLPAVRRERLPGGAAGDGEVDCRSGPLQGAGRRRASRSTWTL